jgi:hypothetical protein
MYESHKTKGHGMNHNPEINLGPLTGRIFDKASWSHNDDFPANQAWADDIELVLAHLQSHGQFERFLSMLHGKLGQRDGALAEARMSFFLNHIGFSIISWEPRGASNSLGDFEIQWESTLPIFVEVKAPSWQGELGESERLVRKKEGKYKNAEVRSLATIRKIIEAIDKSKEQNKFLAGKPNLLAVYTSNLFNSHNDVPGNILKPKIENALKSSCSISGVFMLHVECQEARIRYKTLLICPGLEKR